MVSSLRRFRSAMVLSLMMSMLSISPGASASTGWSPPSTDWVTFPREETVLNSITIAVVGTPDGQGGCDYNLTGDMAADDSDLLFEELAENPTTCQMTLLEGNVPSGIMDYDDPTGSGQTSSCGEPPEAHETNYDSELLSGVPSTLEGGYSDPGTSPGSLTHHAYAKAWFRDPLHIKVTLVRARALWHYTTTGSTVYRAITAGACWRWFALDNWDRTSSPWTNTYNPSRTRSAVHGGYVNGLFCALTPTYNDLDAAVYGQPSGGFHWSWHWHKSGACAGLLKAEMAIGWVPK